MFHPQCMKTSYQKNREKDIFFYFSGTFVWAFDPHFTKNHREKKMAYLLSDYKLRPRFKLPGCIFVCLNYVLFTTLLTHQIFEQEFLFSLLAIYSGSYVNSNIFLSFLTMYSTYYVYFEFHS